MDQLPEETKLRLSRLLNKMRFSDTVHPIPVRYIWFQQQYFSRDRAYISQKMHRHTFAEVHFPISGEAEYLLADGTRLTVKEGEYLYLPPTTTHRLCRTDRNYAKFSFGFQVDAVAAATLGLYFPDVPAVFPLANGMTECFSLILLAADKQPAIATEWIRNTLFSLTVLLGREKENNRTAETVQHNEDIRLSRAKRFIADNRTRALSVGEVAAFAHLSVRQLGRLFSEEEGTTLSAYIRTARCAAAKELLLTTSLTLSEIADALSFSDEYNFIRFFRNVEGTAPGAFRRAAHVIP